MKKILYAAASLCICGAMLFSACESEQTPPGNGTPEKEVTVLSTQDSITLKESQVTGYDYTPYFLIEEDGNFINVLSSYIDSSQVAATAGAYTVSCTYENKSADLTVNVAAPVYALSLSSESVTLKLSAVDSYDFKSLFEAATDGRKTEITDAMVTSDVKSEPGEYAFTVKHGDKNLTLTVTVIPDHELYVVPAYTEYDLPENEISSFDVTSLFYIYSDGEAVRVRKNMIDASALEGAKAGDSATVTITYSESKASLRVNIVKEKQLVLTAKNIVTYPNDSNIDLTELFTVTYGGENIAVTPDMISGGIDYSEEGVNSITLSYGGRSCVAEVEVKRGVVIRHASADNIIIKKGTNKDAYNFGADFDVRSDGIKLTNLVSYIDASTADFDTVGTYTVKMRVPYNDKRVTLDLQFGYTELEIFYTVVENTASVIVKEPLVVLPIGTTSYNVKSNLTVSVNGINKQLVENKEWADVLSVYYKQISDPIDFSSAELQKVQIAVYAYGPESDPVISEFGLRVASEAKITAKDIAVYVGDTLDVRSLFEIYEDGEKVEVGFDMLTGKVDTFTAGVYTIGAEYYGTKATAHVTVFNENILGAYKTLLTTIPQNDDDDDGEWGEGYGDSVYSLTETSYAASGASRIGDLIITRGGIEFNNRTVSSIKGVDEKTLLLTVGTDIYTMIIEDGVAVLIPDNPLRLGFSDYRRPLIYFSEKLWNIEEHIVINYSDTHVLKKDTKSYSIDTFKVATRVGSLTRTYALMIDLVEKMNSDTVYNVTWGQAVYADGFVNAKDGQSSLEFDGRKYSFTMTSKGVGKVDKPSAEKRYKNLTFTGAVSGEKATLSADGIERYTFVVGSKTLFSGYGSDYDLSNSMLNGGADYAASTININSYAGDHGIFSYKFKVDVNNASFELLDKDLYFGKYVCGNMALFLDGYGQGVMWFDNTSHVRTKLEYSVNAGVLTIVYVETKPNFQYGSKSTFYIDPLLNKLTAKEFTADSGAVFENTIISNGAIVKISSFTILAEAELIAREKFVAGVNITTENGNLDRTQLNEVLDLSCVNFTRAGCYRFTVTVQIEGKPVTSYYTLQILPNLYPDSSIPAAYGSGVYNSTYSLFIDSYGTAQIKCGGVVYSGACKIAGDSVYIWASNPAAGSVTATGTLVESGLIKLTVSGAANFTDYFTSGAVRTTGCEGIVLKQISLENRSDAYLVSIKPTSVGEVATVVFEQGDAAEPGSVFTLAYQDGRTVKLRLNAWNNLTEGLVVIE